MFLRGSSTFFVASASGNGSRRGFSLGNVVLTMKKISRRNAMSASEDDGISLFAFDFLLSPPWIIAPSLHHLQGDPLRASLLELVQHRDHVPVRRVRVRLHRGDQVRVLANLLPP